MPLVSEVNPGGLCQTDVIHAAMLEEAPVFYRQHRIHHRFRDIVIFDDLAFGPLLGIEEGSYQLGFEFISRQVTRFALNIGHLAALDLDGCLFRAVVGLGSRLHLNFAVSDAVAT